MPTSAKIERAKLAANFYNSVAIGVVIGGALIPFLTAAQHLDEIVDHLQDGRAFAFPDVGIATGAVLAICLALEGGKRLRRMASDALGVLDENSN
ncbi:MAG: hypothetical protein JSS35_13100 [Proteobacteria bacterium]|nr:hypothetical protein [Pseudomonadota bacterium]